MKLLPLLAALAIVASPVSAQQRPTAQPTAEREAMIKQCDSEASAKKLSGAARGSFVSECLARKPAAAQESATKAAAPKDDASNLRQKELQDAQHRKWNSSAERAMRSICAGCGQGGAAPRPRKARRAAPVEEDAEYGVGTLAVDDLD